MDDPYNEAVRDCFENPDHAGDLQGVYDLMLTADAAESGQGAKVVLSAGVAAGTIAEMRFRVWGCPHLVAAAETLCRERENGPVSGFSQFDVSALMEHLSVPAAKTGKMLLLEDVLKSLRDQHEHAA